MLNRARKLQLVFDQYCITHSYVQFKLDQEEWRQVEYLLLITNPFFDFTNVLSQTRDVTVHNVFSIYNRLFSHFDNTEKELKRKGVPWKKRMLRALQAAKQKLSRYYTATDNEAYGTVYAIATILSPSKKLRYFDNADWKGTNEKGEPVGFMKTYREVLQKEFRRYQQLQQASLEKEPADVQVFLDPVEDELDILCGSQTALQAEADQPEDKITRYLAKGLTKGSPRLFWKEHQHEYPILARIARDILSTPASGAGAERLFNCARDIYHYRRGQLKPDTIKDVMLHSFSSKFDFEQSELEMIKMYLSAGEAAMLDQTRKSVPSLDDVDPISDNEDGCETDDISDDTDDDEDDKEELTPMQVAIQRKQLQRKRPRSKITEAADDNDDGLPLPEMPTNESRQSRLGRIWKKPRLPDGFEIDKP